DGERGGLMAVTNSRTESATISIIAAGTVVTGDVATDGVLKVEGQVIGNVQARQQLLVARGGSVQGNIETAQAVIGGVVTGSISASDRVEIQGAASVEGDVVARRLVVLEGGRLNGSLEMRAEPAA
ncbi:MAG: bactofilin family protein, partial [Gemmatimonadales bacterium]